MPPSYKPLKKTKNTLLKNSKSSEQFMKDFGRIWLPIGGLVIAIH
jgi:hypothetical protein